MSKMVFGLKILVTIVVFLHTVGLVKTCVGESGINTGTCIVADWPAQHAKCRPVPLSEVKVSGYLGRRIERNLNSVLAGLKSPIPRGFEARAAGKELPPEANHLAADSDLYKWLEGASYVYAQT